MKNLIVALLVVAIVGALGWFFLLKGPSEPVATETPGATTTPTGTETPAAVPEGTAVKIGSSADGNDINAYHYGTGAKEVLFVGGIHGGYAPSTELVAFELMDWLHANPDKIPANVKVTVIPMMNPDGVDSVIGDTDRFSESDIPPGDRVKGRFNGNEVDLNRNFDCDWAATGTWQTQKVSGGTSAFSEPEAQAIKSYVEANDPAAVIAWYAAANGVFASNCHTGILPETRTLMNLYADASGYAAHEVFDYYETTGDMTNWLSKIGIPAISVLLGSHTDDEFAKNYPGIVAVLEHYAN